MLDTNSLKPLYIQLEAEIRQALREKKYLPGDRLPSEEKLCEQYQVSRITVRKAIQQLTDQHILEKHRGKGTFVSTPSRSIDLKEQSGFTNYLSAIGHKSHHLLLKKELQPSDDFLCETLSLQPNEPVCYVQRLIFEDDSPLALDEIYISSLTYPDFLDRITGDISMNCSLTTITYLAVNLYVRLLSALQMLSRHPSFIVRLAILFFFYKKRVLQLTAHRSIIHALLCAVIESPIPYAHKI